MSIIGNAEIVSSQEAVEIAAGIDGLVDLVLVDAEIKSEKLSGMPDKVMNTIKKSKVLTYKDNDSFVSATDAFIYQMVPDFTVKNITVLGDTSSGCKLALKLAERGAHVTIWGKNITRLTKIKEALNLVLQREALGKISARTELIEASNGADILIGVIPYLPIITSPMLGVMSATGFVIDAGVGTIYPDAVEYGINRGIQLYRLDMRAGLAGEVTTVLETLELTRNIIGSEECEGFRLVAGGVLGMKGDIVVDSISSPTRIIGVADGKGGLLKHSETQKFQHKLTKAKLLMVERRLHKTIF